MADDITKLTISGRRIGLIGVGRAFAAAKALSSASDKLLSETLLAEVSRTNYIPPEASAQYAEALLKAFRGQSSGPGQDEIVLIGAGCPTCKRMSRDIIAILEEDGVAADFQYSSDPASAKAYGNVTVPVLVVGGKVVSSGKALTKNELRRMIVK